MTIIPGINTISGNGGNLKYKRTLFTTGVMFGVQGISSNSGLGIDFYIGGGYRFKNEFNFSGNIDIYDPAVNFPELRLGLSIVFSNAR